jgi:hypothetical protein
MITLYRAEDTPDADWIEAELKDMVLGYEIVALPPGAACFPAEPSILLPVLVHDDRLISGREAQIAYLVELRRLAERWRLFQGDFCYIDEDGEAC